MKSKYRTALPQLAGGSFLGYAGMMTDLIFNHGIDLPDLAEYTLLESAEGRERFYALTLTETDPEMLKIIDPSTAQFFENSL